MCCLFLSLMFFGPRLAFFVYWLLPVGRAKVILAFDTWLWPILGLIFAPWTTLMYVFVYGSNGIVGFDWFLLALAVIADIATYAGGAAKRRQVPYVKTLVP